MADITSLPEHISIEIFGNLSPKMLKTCSLVCKSWDNIISNTTELMENFLLNLNKPVESIRSAKDIRRKHQSSFIVDLSADEIDVICKHSLKSLNVSSIGPIKVSLMIEALNNLPALKNFDASYVEFTDDTSNDVDLKKIQTCLEQLICDDRIIHIFDCSTLRKLKLTSQERDYYNRKAVIDLLSQQKDLQDLGLSNGDFFSSDDIFQLKMSLKSLKYSKYQPVSHYEDFIRFLRLQENSLTSLVLDFCTCPEFGIETIHEFVFDNLKKLKHLQLGYIGFDAEIEQLSFKDLKPEKHTSNSIESLNFRPRYDLNETKVFFEMLPNLMQLTFEAGNHETDDDQLLLHISTTNTKLEVLNVSTIINNSFENLYFPNLKEFSVPGLFKEDEADLIILFNNHYRTLEKISLQDAEIITETLAKKIMNCEQLKSLELLTHETSLDCLQLFSDISLKRPFTLTTKINGIKEVFKFPDDKALWDEKIKSLNCNN